MGMAEYNWKQIMHTWLLGEMEWAKQVISPEQCLSEFLFNNAETEQTFWNRHIHISGVNMKRKKINF